MPTAGLCRYFTPKPRTEIAARSGLVMDCCIAAGSAERAGRLVATLDSTEQVLVKARELVDEIFCCFGTPEELHSDQAWNFEAEVLATIRACLGVMKTCTMPLHPQSDGLVEQFNRTLAI